MTPTVLVKSNSGKALYFQSKNPKNDQNMPLSLNQITCAEDLVFGARGDCSVSGCERYRSGEECREYRGGEVEETEIATHR